MKVKVMTTQGKHLGYVDINGDDEKPTLIRIERAIYSFDERYNAYCEEFIYNAKLIL